MPLRCGWSTCNNSSPAFSPTPRNAGPADAECTSRRASSICRPSWYLSVIEVESGFDRYAISRVGAQGLMQVMPFWKEEIGRGDDNLTHTATNLRYGCYMSCASITWTGKIRTWTSGTGCLQRLQRQPALPRQGPQRMAKPLAHGADRLVRLLPAGGKLGGPTESP